MRQRRMNVDRKKEYKRLYENGQSMGIQFHMLSRFALTGTLSNVNAIKFHDTNAIDYITKLAECSKLFNVLINRYPKQDVNLIIRTIRFYLIYYATRHIYLDTFTDIDVCSKYKLPDSIQTFIVELHNTVNPIN